MAPAALSPARHRAPRRRGKRGPRRKRKRIPEPRRKWRLSGETERGGAGMWRLLLALAGLGGALAAGEGGGRPGRGAGVSPLICSEPEGAPRC